MHMPLLIQVGSWAIVVARDWLAGLDGSVLWLVPLGARYDAAIVAAAAMVAPVLVVAVWVHHRFVVQASEAFVRKLGSRVTPASARVWLRVCGCVACVAAVLQAHNLAKLLHRAQ